MAYSTCSYPTLWHTFLPLLVLNIPNNCAPLPPPAAKKAAINFQGGDLKRLYLIQSKTVS